ncbi:right-handed parallel beta-helix repeat-containing protein [bacterium]
MNGDNSRGLELFVSLDGNDFWSGKYPETVNMGTDGPFKTLERARDAVRVHMRSGLLPSGGVKIYLREGIYFRDKTFELSKADSGAPISKIVYRQYENEKVRIIGGAVLDPEWFQPVTDENVFSRLTEEARISVLQVNLGEHGITDYGEMHPRSNWHSENYPAGMELFFETRPMQIARYPNKNWLKIASVPDGNKGAAISYIGDRPKKWQSISNVLLHGYWTHDWADSYVKIESIDTEKRAITTAEPFGAYGYTSGHRYYFLNILEELDRPGEWYIDRENGLLYFWPPREIEGSEIFVSTLEAPLIRLTNASDLVISGITFEATRTHGLVIEGGARNEIAGCTFRNIGRSAVTINGGRKNGVLSSDIYNVGENGIIVRGGDRKTLTPAGHYVVNNHIHHFSRWLRTYSPAVKMSGVGNTISHNHIHDAPHEAIGLGGNDHVIEFNEIHDVTWETNDVGALYIGRNWTERGNIVRHNFFHHIRSMFGYGASSGGLGASSVYLDDMASGTTVYGNIFYKASRATFIGGGRDNRIDNNVFIDCDVAVLVDARGVGWASQSVKPGGVMHERLVDMNYKNPPYSERYPELIGILEDDPGLPKGNVIARNIIYKTEFLMLQNVDRKLLTIKNNFEGDPEFTDPENMKFYLKYRSPALVTGFERIPIADIGLYKDKYRKKIPDK